MKTKKPEEIPFEKAFSRLEHILEKMNQGELGLEESLRLYEEADQLLALCSRHLNEAEKRIEKIVKQRNGKVATDAEGNPIVESFTPPSHE